jgi:protein-S-isoprenylcysteine O-methyltransferase Ste14
MSSYGAKGTPTSCERKTMSETEPPDNPRVLVHPPAVYAAGLLAGWGLQRLRAWPFLPPSWTRPIGLTFLIAGLVGFAGLQAFLRVQTSPNPYRPAAHLVTGGPYRFTRNPMYLGFTLWYLGASAWMNALWPLVLLPVVLLVIQRGVIAREEAYLQRRFGRDYTEYQARVRRWL